jgi:hypothetical protein
MSIDQKIRRTTSSPMQNGLVALCAVGVILLISWRSKYSAYGIDFTDESFYLLWIANPFIYDESITQFSFVYHPLYRLLNGDVAALRQANILITFALAWGLTYSFFISLLEGCTRYIAAAMVSAKKARFEPNTPIIDLSGRSPRILFSINARNTGQPWTLGGYPRSLPFVKAVLSHFSYEDISQTWVLYKPHGPRNIWVELMTAFGADFPANYDHVGSWQTAEEAGGRAVSSNQKLYKPKFYNETFANCKKLRGLP